MAHPGGLFRVVIKGSMGTHSRIETEPDGVLTHAAEALQTDGRLEHLTKEDRFDLWQPWCASFRRWPLLWRPHRSYCHLLSVGVLWAENRPLTPLLKTGAEEEENQEGAQGKRRDHHLQGLVQRKPTMLTTSSRPQGCNPLSSPRRKPRNEHAGSSSPHGALHCLAGFLSWGEASISQDAFCSDLGLADTKMVIFTSGTTGHPKGVESSFACPRPSHS
jgi:hypothetical protein